MAVDSKKIMDRVVQIVCNQLDKFKEQVSAKSSFVDDLGATSLDLVELLMALEEEFDLLHLPESEVRGIRTLGEAVAFIERRLTAAGRTYEPAH